MRSSLSLSFVVHGALFVLWMISIEKRASDWQGKETPAPGTLVPIDITQVTKQQDEKTSKRIVESERLAKTEDSAKDAFLGEQNQKVSRQTVTRGQKTLGSGGAPARPQARTPPKAGAGSNLLSHLGVPLFSAGMDGKKSESRPDQPRWASEGAGSNAPRDYIEGVSESDRTALNTREYIFFGYFQRIRSRLDVAWTSTLRTRLEKLYRRGRRIASEQELKTRTWVTLDAQGKVIRVRLLEESGVLDLDEAAIAAFNEAGPFPNPPRGLIDEKGQIELHWDFVLRN